MYENLFRLADEKVYRNLLFLYQNQSVFNAVMPTVDSMDELPYI